MVFTSILLVILNSSYWLCFIIIFCVYYSKINFIYAIPFIFRFLVLVVTSNHPVTVSLFFYQHNGIVSPSPLLIVICCRFSLFLRCPWVRPLIVFADYIGSTFLSNHIIALYHHYFSQIIMALFHRQHCWLLYFKGFSGSYPRISATTHCDCWLHWK